MAAGSPGYTRAQRIWYTGLFLVTFELPVCFGVAILGLVLLRAGGDPAALERVSGVMNAELASLLSVALAGMITTPFRLWYLFRTLTGATPARSFFRYLMLVLLVAAPSILLGSGSIAGIKEVIGASIPLFFIGLIAHDAYGRAALEPGGYDAAAPRSDPQVVSTRFKSPSISLVSVREIPAVGREERILGRYAKELAVLEPLGFTRLSLIEERTVPGVLLLAPLAFVPALFAESGSTDATLRLIVRHPLLLSPDRRTVAVVMKIAINFYTFLSDGRVIKSSPLQKGQVYKESTGAFLNPIPKGPAEGFASHEARVLELTKDGAASAITEAHFERYSDFAKRNAGPAALFVPTVISWVVIDQLLRLLAGTSLVKLIDGL